MREILKILGFDKWLWQTTGVIDHGVGFNYPGTQPIRVLLHVTIHYFQNTHVGFLNEIKLLIKENKLDSELDIQFGEVPIEIELGRYRTPRIHGGKIQIHETFLSYQWAVSYAIYVLFLELIDYPKINSNVGFVKYKVTEEKIENAKKLFDYAKLLIKHFESWDKDLLPNPERYQAEERNYVEQSSMFFTESIKFILCHEFAHAKKHMDNLPDESCNSCFQEIENEADNIAIDNIMQGDILREKIIVEVGIVLGILSMIFFRSTTTGIKHPNVEDRLTNALIRMGALPNSDVWAIACIGLELWDKQFNLSLDWTQSGQNYKDLYYSIIEQIKSRKSQ